VKDYTANLVYVADVVDGIRVQDQKVRGLAGRDGPLSARFSEKIGGISCGRLEGLQRGKSRLDQQRKLIMKGEARKQKRRLRYPFPRV
jgi:hypothetical protein